MSRHLPGWGIYYLTVNEAEYLMKNYGDRNTLRDLHNSYITGLSLRAGGRGFPVATQSITPGYFRR